MAVLLIAFCLTSCVEVTFPEPMPVNRKELDSFPKSWQGTWTSNEGTDDADDEDILVIQADRVSDSKAAKTCSSSAKIVFLSGWGKSGS